MIFKTVTADTNTKNKTKYFGLPSFQWSMSLRERSEREFEFEDLYWRAEQVSKCWEIEQVDENSELKKKLKNFGSKGKTGRHTLPLLTPALYGAKKQIILKWNALWMSCIVMLPLLLLLKILAMSQPYMPIPIPEAQKRHYWTYDFFNLIYSHTGNRLRLRP